MIPAPTDTVPALLLLLPLLRVKPRRMLCAGLPYRVKRAMVLKAGLVVVRAARNMTLQRSAGPQRAASDATKRWRNNSMCASYAHVRALSCGSAGTRARTLASVVTMCPNFRCFLSVPTPTASFSTPARTGGAAEAGHDRNALACRSGGALLPPPLPLLAAMSAASANHSMRSIASGQGRTRREGRGARPAGGAAAWRCAAGGQCGATGHERRCSDPALDVTAR